MVVVGDALVVCDLVVAVVLAQTIGMIRGVVGEVADTRRSLERRRRIAAVAAADAVVATYTAADP
jgi:hypothetical protein